MAGFYTNLTGGPTSSDSPRVTTPEIIVEISAEGGSITLFGHKGSNGEWRFARGVNDQTPTLLPEEEGGVPAISHDSCWVNTWPQALALLDRYPWAMLAVTKVHPEFRERLWAEASLRLKDKTTDTANGRKERWAQACHIQ
jgi:hypothetical protein